MKVFNKGKLKVKSELKDDDARFYIDYYRVNEEDDFKIRLLKEIIGSSLCLAIVDTKLAYKKITSEKDMPDRLIGLLENLNIEYKKIEVKVNPSVTVFGAAFKMNSTEKSREYIIGFTINSENLMEMKDIIDNYNIRYYVSNDYTNKDGVLSKIRVYYEDEDKMVCDFKYNIFDNNTSKNMVVYCMKENSQIVDSIIESINKK